MVNFYSDKKSLLSLQKVYSIVSLLSFSKIKSEKLSLITSGTYVITQVQVFGDFNRFIIKQIFT